ncbi:MAG: triacylglycerol lipase [Micromonosporaceae bacterium]|nr:triacylglycerol lipase [Micromonosporaceae bacterium]
MARVPLVRHLSPRRRVLVAVVVALVAATLVTAVVRAVAGGGTPTGYPDQSRPGTVLLVPGYGGSANSLAALAARIRSVGRTAAVVDLPGNDTGDLVAQAAALDAAVARARRSAAGSVDLIGYSAGGVVVRLWVARHGGDHSARRVVTLGSPLHGARLAAVGSVVVPGACPVACQQLVPGSSLLAELNAMPLPARLPWLSVWTVNDETVTPPDSARLSGAVNLPGQSICPDARVAHGQLPTDPLVTGLVLRAIGTARMTAPGAADCAALRAQGRN